MTEAQKQKFLDISGYNFDDITEQEFMTLRPYNDLEWKYSPWYVIWKYIEADELLCIEIGHRMTNERPYTFDKFGNDTKDERYIEITGFNHRNLKDEIFKKEQK